MHRKSPRRNNRLPQTVCEAFESRRLLSTVYYVSPTGNDSNAGTSVDAPWKTVAKVNASSFQSGDEILFQRGGQWRESLSASSDGAAGAPIVYGAYGDASQARPLFVGSNVLDPSSFTLVSGTTYSMVSPVAINWVFDNHQFTHESQDYLSLNGRNASDPTANLTYVENTSGSFYYNATTDMLYVNLGSAPTGHTITVAERADAVYNNGHSYLTFQDLAVTETAQDNAGYAFRAQGGSNIHIIDCDASLAGKHHFGDIDSTAFLGENLTAEQAPPDLGFGGASATVTFSDSTQPNTTAQWINITWTQQNGAYPIFVSHGDPGAVANLLVQNAVTSGYGTGIYIQTSGPNEVARVIGGHIDETDVQVPTNNSLVSGVLMTGVDADVQVSGTNDVVENCVFSGLAPNIDGGHNGGLQDSGTNNILRFNTFDFTSNIGPAIAIFGSTTDTQIYANIFTNPVPVRLFQNDGSATLTSDFNVFSGTPIFQTGDAGHTGTITLAAWRSRGYDVDSLIADPKFTNEAAGDFSLLYNSPAVNLYTQTPADAPATDFAGNPRLVGSGYDAGAFEYQQPVTVTQTSLSADHSTATAGSVVTFTASVSGAGANSSAVEFFDGNTLLGSAPLQSNNTATFSDSTLSQGAHSITAEYQGDGMSLLSSTSSAVAETISPAPFTASVSQSTLPASAISGASVKGTVTASFTNRTAHVESGTFTINLFASQSGVVDGSAVRVVATTRKMTFKPGQTLPISISITSLPPNLPAGQYVLLSQIVDPTKTVSNATTGKKIKVVAGVAKLTPSIQHLTLPAKVTAGAKTNATATIKIANTGNIASAGLTTVSVYARSRSDQSLTLLKSVKTSMSIAVGHPVSVSVPIASFPKQLLGVYDIVLSITDPHGHIISANTSGHVTVIA